MKRESAPERLGIRDGLIGRNDGGHRVSIPLELQRRRQKGRTRVAARRLQKDAVRRQRPQLRENQVGMLLGSRDEDVLRQREEPFERLREQTPLGKQRMKL